MKPEINSQSLLGMTRSMAKMYEYNVPVGFHIEISRDPLDLAMLTLGMLGDQTAKLNTLSSPESIDGGDHLKFSAYFFDSYCQTRLRKEIDPYLTILGAASYYLSDLPGSATVLAERLGDECPNLDGQGLERVMHWLLVGQFKKTIKVENGKYEAIVRKIVPKVRNLFLRGENIDDVLAHADHLRALTYESGSPRELLFADTIAALIRKRYWNSTWYCLAKYSGLSVADWLPALSKDSFIRELWPAQKLLGECGVFLGKSAIVQMPTSAGKTRACELIIRSSFLSLRTELAVIVAPFRSLCHEIRNSMESAFSGESVAIDVLSDVAQADFDIESLTAGQRILVVTPEKLMYVLRHSPELADDIGLLIYDEGHQFDNGLRGITYELLLTTLKSMISENTQLVLISAVINNASAIGSWLLTPA